MREQTHVVTITIDAKYVHGSNQHISLQIGGDGGIEHMIEVFKVTLLAAGFGLETVKRMEEWDT